MIIESIYWKEELHRIYDNIMPVAKPPRWSERRYNVLLRDITIGFFIIRKMIELNKVSSKIQNGLYCIFACNSICGKITRLNKFEIFELYDIDNEIEETKNILYIANQFIHSYTGIALRDRSRNWSDIYVVSDYERNNCIWRIPIATVCSIFVATAEDYPSSYKMEYCTKKNDYTVVTD